MEIIWLKRISKVPGIFFVTIPLIVISACRNSPLPTTSCLSSVGNTLESRNMASSRRKRGNRTSSKRKRGTVDYMQDWLNNSPQYPLYWSISKPSSTDRLEIVSVDEQTKNDIIEIVTKTWNKRMVGKGIDAKNLVKYTKIEVLDVERVENTLLYDRYRQTREKILRDKIESRRNGPEIKIGYTGTVQSTIQMRKRIKKDLCLEVNEVYLYHGTTVDRIGGITSGGYKLSENGMFGPGIYLAEKATKADQYADESKDRSPPGHRLKLILNRTLLGNVKPCKEPEHFESAPTGYSSVMAQGYWIFREFVVYDESQVYPEYVITYKRI